MHKAAIRAAARSSSLLVSTKDEAPPKRHALPSSAVLGMPPAVGEQCRYSCMAPRQPFGLVFIQCGMHKLCTSTPTHQATSVRVWHLSTFIPLLHPLIPCSRPRQLGPASHGKCTYPCMSKKTWEDQCRTAQNEPACLPQAPQGAHNSASAELHPPDPTILASPPHMPPHQRPPIRAMHNTVR